MDCSCERMRPLPHSFQRTPLGKCKMCRGWRKDVPTLLTIREVFSAELPAALRVDVQLPGKVYEGLRIQGERNLLTGVPMYYARIHRDDASTLLDRARIALQRGRL